MDWPALIVAAVTHVPGFLAAWFAWKAKRYIVELHVKINGDKPQ